MKKLVSWKVTRHFWMALVIGLSLAAYRSSSNRPLRKPRFR